MTFKAISKLMFLLTAANQGTAQHGPLDPVWLAWEDFAMKVYHFWRLVGPQHRERPDKQPRARLAAEPPVPPPAAPAARVPAADAPFQLGEHQRVVKHADFLQSLDCNRQAGRVSKLLASYMRTQDYRQLKIERVKKRPTGFAAPSEVASSSGGPPDGEATGGPLRFLGRALRCQVESATQEMWGLVRSIGTTGDVGHGRTETRGISRPNRGPCSCDARATGSQDLAILPETTSRA
eukprot:3526932-Amphidinium_carterae.1